jgi:hypothetical protein
MWRLVRLWGGAVMTVLGGLSLIAQAPTLGGVPASTIAGGAVLVGFVALLSVVVDMNRDVTRLKTRARHEFMPASHIANGDGTTRQFKTLTPYVPGSLTVWTDALQTHAVETNPSEGIFELTFVPYADQHIEAAWRIADAD